MDLIYITALIPLFVFCDGGVAPGYSCGTIPNFCERMHCTAPHGCNDGILLNGGGLCKCCQVCLKYRDRNEECFGEATEPFQLPTDSFSQYYEYDTCRPGLKCNETSTQPGICQPLDSGDQSQKYFHDCSYQYYDAPSHDWEAPPTCDYYGNFAYKRCKGCDPARCYCVSKTGGTIFGRLPTGSDNVTCAGSRTVYELQTSTDSQLQAVGHMIMLQETGDFSALQCFGGICLCVNVFTGSVTSSAVPIAAIQALPCWDDKLYTTNFYSDCEAEYLKMTALLEMFKIKGVVVAPFELTNCDPDGTYGPVQTINSGVSWYCGDRQGNQMGSYIATSYGDYLSMLCNCARDVNYPDGLPDSGKTRVCVQNGNYADVYCLNSQCNCLDSDGQTCSDSFPRTEQTSVNCTAKCLLSQ